MKIFRHVFFLAALPALLVAACAGNAPARPEPESMPKSVPAPPVAAVRPHVVESPNGNRTDEYYWLRDDTRTDKDVLGYLEAENAYKAAMTAHTQALEDKVYEEIVGRIKQDDSTVPYRLRGYWYYTRFETGKEYPVYARKAGTLDAPEQLMLDANAMAEGHGFFHIGATAIAPDNRLLAYAEDTVGRRQYVLRFKDLATGATLPDRIDERRPVPRLGRRQQERPLPREGPGDAARAPREAPRARHRSGAGPARLRAADESFYTGVTTTKDEKYILIDVQSTLSSEWRYARADDPALAFKVFRPRERDFEYYVDHLDGRWIIRTNWQAPNYRLMEAKVGEEGDRANWKEIVAHREDAFIHAFDVFKDFLAIEERSGAIRKIRIRPWGGGKDFYIASDEPAYATSLGQNAEIDTHIVRYAYTSLTTPETIYDYDIRTGERQLMKRTPVLGGYDPANYRTELVWAAARDGAKVPVSLVYRVGFTKDGTAPLLQYGYGSYGATYDPAFSVARVSLLDRGFVYALAHIRGGQEMGRRWYDEGRLLNKKNTFTDFIDVTRFLVKEGYADAEARLRDGRQRRRAADGRGREHGARRLPRDRRAGAVRRRRDDDARREHPAHDQRVRRVGQPEEEGVLRLHAVVLALRQRLAAGLSGDARDDRPVGQPGAVLRAGQVGRAPAHAQDRPRTRSCSARRWRPGTAASPGRFQRFREIAEEYAFILDQSGITQ